MISIFETENIKFRKQFPVQSMYHLSIDFLTCLVFHKCEHIIVLTQKETREVCQDSNITLMVIRRYCLDILINFNILSITSSYSQIYQNQMKKLHCYNNFKETVREDLTTN